MSTTDRDRRTESRTPLVLKVEYPSVDGFLQDYSANISRGGTMIYGRRDVGVGEDLELVISFPGLLRPIRLLGVVRWSRPQENGELAFGVEFHKDPDAGWSTLQDLASRIAAGDTRVVASETLRLLVVEDNPHMASLIRRGLETHLWRSTEGLAFDIQQVENGRDALELLEKVGFDLLLVDVLMPVMDGESLIRHLRGDARWRDVPVIAFSAEGDEARRTALEAGADFFLPKPLRLAELLGTIRRLASASSA